MTSSSTRGAASGSAGDAASSSSSTGDVDKSIGNLGNAISSSSPAAVTATLKSKRKPQSSKSKTSQEYDWITTTESHHQNNATNPSSNPNSNQIKTVFGPPLPPFLVKQNNDTQIHHHPHPHPHPHHIHSSQKHKSPNRKKSATTSKNTFTAPNGLPYSVITNITAERVNMNATTNNNDGGGSTIVNITGDVPSNMNMDYMNMIHNHMNHIHQQQHGGASNNNNTSSNNANHTLPSMPGLQGLPGLTISGCSTTLSGLSNSTDTITTHNPMNSVLDFMNMARNDEALKKYVEEFTNVTSGTTSSSSSSSLSTPTATNMNTDITTAANTNNMKSTNSRSTSPSKNSTKSNINSTSINTYGQPCSEAEMKALMSMFVEIMGMSSSSFNNMNNNNDHQHVKYNQSPSSGKGGNNCNTTVPNIDSAAIHAAREHITKLHLQNTVNNSTKNNNVSHNTKSNTNKNRNINNNQNHSNNVTNMIPPPPGGWPPGAAAAAAAALAAASSGATSVTVPISGGSISLPLGIMTGGGIHNTMNQKTSQQKQQQTDWMKDAYKFMNEYNEYDDASDISARYGSGDESENDDDDDYDDDYDDDDLDNNEIHPPVVKPAPQDRRTGVQKIMTNPNNKRSSSIDEDKSAEQAAAELLREEEEAERKLNEEEERLKRAAKKREKKNRKKEKARREAAIKAAQTAQKKREKVISSWRSRVASACVMGEVNKVEVLTSDHPFKDSKQHQIDPNIVEELDGETLSFEEEVNWNMLWLLPSCIIKSRSGKLQESEARSKLSKFVMEMSFNVVFELRQNKRSALHTACLVGDFHFVKLVTEKIRKEQHKENSLDEHCQTLGWSPLHYAAAAGWSDVVELLLASGCDLSSPSDPSLMSLLSDDNKGLTAKELLEYIHDDSFETNVEFFNEESFQEILDSKTGETSTSESYNYKNSIKSIIKRLTDVEMNGYSPLQNTKADGSIEKSGMDDGKSQEKQISKSKPEVEESKTSKKKKKKKKKGQISNNDGAEEVTIPPSVSSAANRGADLDMVSMLLAMGFTEDRINAAVNACGGTDRATADDLVEWILSEGASTNSNAANNLTDEPSQSGTTIGISGSGSNVSQLAGSDLKQSKALEEATKREAEAKAAAERLAAKREEQRRIRREWNNKEQLRQQEEAKAKLAEEVERKRRIEIEKAKVAAQRAAKERAAASANLMYQEVNAGMPSMHEDLALQNSINVGLTPLFPGMTFPRSNDQNQSLADQFYNHMQSPNVGFGSSMMPQVETYPQAVSSYRTSPVPSINMPSHDYSSSRSKPNKASPINIDVNGNEFPVLGANKSSSPNRKNKSKKGSPHAGDNKKGGGKSKMRKKKETTMKDKRPTECVMSVDNVVSGQVASDPTLLVQRQYESNPLGEIRATAKAFVPSHFKPSAGPPMPPGFTSTPMSHHPEMIPSSKSNTVISSNTAASGSSILSSSPSPIPSVHANTMSTLPTTLKDPTVTDQPFGHLNSRNQLSFASSSPMTPSFGNSSEPEQNQSSRLLGSTRITGLPGSSLIGSSLGILDSNTAAPSLSGSSIWGAANVAASTPSLPNSSGLGGFSFNFADSNIIPNTRNDANNDDNKDSSANMWGGGVSSLHSSGGGSIW